MLRRRSKVVVVVVRAVVYPASEKGAKPLVYKFKVPPRATVKSSFECRCARGVLDFSALGK